MDTPQNITVGRPARRPAPQRRPSDFLGSLQIWQKLVLIALAFTLPLLGIVGLLVSRQNRDLATAYNERVGAGYITALEGLLEGVPQHRGLTNALLNGNESVRERRDEVAAGIRNALQAVAVIDAETGSTLRSSESFGVLRQELEGLLEQADTLSAAESFSEHTRIINDRIIPLISSVAANSELLLTPDIDVYYLGELVVQQLPRLTESLGQLRDYGAGLLARGSATPEERQVVSNLANVVRVEVDEVDQTVSTLESANPEFGAEVRVLLEQAVGPATRSVRLAQEQIVSAPSLTLDSTEYFDEFTRAIDAYSVMNRANIATLNEVTTDRITAIQRDQLISLTLIALSVALTYLLVATIARRISGPINQLFNASKRLSQGDLTTHAAVSSTDELGALATTFNDSVTQLRLKAQADADASERNALLQGNIGNFLNVAMDIADGDFTKRGQVSEDALGNVVDAINLMVEEIALLLGDVQKTALSVNQGAGEMIGSAGAIAENTQLTADEAQRVRSEVQRVILSIQDVAERANSANEAATRALSASQEGQEAVNTTLTGMAGIREETRTTAERMHGLVERSAEISEIVETISHIASQTNLLALGAALEAAGAGEAGDRFAVVADEVRKLADESAEAASRIYTLINTVQSEVREVGEQVARNAVEVDTGYRLAGQAGERLREITESVQRSAQLVEGISQVTGAQTRGVEEVGVAVQSMAELTDTARERVLQGQETAATLQRLAERLTEALVRFRLA